MLAVIDPTGTGATSNAQLITMNFMRAVQAVATLAAGAATPTVNAITQSNTIANSVILTHANTNMGLWYYTTGFVNAPPAGSNVYGLSANVSISATNTATFTATAATTTLTVTAVSAGNIQPGMVLTGTSIVPNNYIVNQITTTATATLATTGSTITSGSNTITITSNTGIAAGLLVANATGGNTFGLVTLPQGTYVGSTYANGVAYTGNTTVPLVNFGGGSVSVTGTGSNTAATISFFPAGANGTYTLGVSHTSGTITGGLTYRLSSPVAACTFVVTTTLFSTNNCVTSLISNTEAGGWSVSSESTITDNYNGANSTVGACLLDMYVQNTNKASYPFQKIAFRQNPSVAFSNASYASYPYIYAYHGASTTNVYSDATFSAFTGPSAIVNQRTTPTAASGFGALIANTLAFPCILAVTANYMHLVQNNYIVSMGYRETQGWEDGYSDNPPVYHFCADTSVYSTSKQYPSSSFFYGRSLSNTGTINTAARYQYAYTAAVVANQPNAVSGQDMNPTVASSHDFGTVYAARAGFTSGVSLPIFVLGAHTTNATYLPFIPPGYDSSNSTFVPSAYPCVMQLNRPGFYNAGGKANGIYKSLTSGNSSAITMTSYYTPGATYTIGSDSYYPAMSGNGLDLFLVRKA